MVSTLAGSGAAGSVDGTGASASFSSPTGVAVDVAGNIYVADTENQKIRNVTPNGIVGTLAGNGSRFGIVDGKGVNAYFAYPRGIVVDGGGTLYVTELYSQIRMISTEGNVTSLPGTLDGVPGIGIDVRGNIYISEGETKQKIYRVQRSPQIRIPAGQTMGTLTIKGLEDTADEEDETIVLTAASVANATLAGNEQVALSLLDSSNPPVVSLSLSDTLVAENGGSIDVVAKLSSVSGKDITLTFTTSGTADTSDYTLSSTTLTIPAGQDSGKITITGKDDNLVEVLETLVFTVASVTNATVEQTSLTCYIDSEDKPTVSLSVSKASFTESEQSVITATLSEPTSKDVIIDLRTGGSAVYEVDYATDFKGKNNVSSFAGNGIQGSVDGIGTVASFNHPRDLTFDTYGNIYVADVDNHKIRKITPNGVVSTIAGSGNTGSSEGIGTSASFHYPSDVAVDSHGNIYVADHYNHRIRKISSSGVVSTLAGSGTQGFANGSGTAAMFGAPTGVTIDGAGNILVADHFNQRIRKITPSGVVSTLAGSGAVGTTNGSNMDASFRYPSDVDVDASGNIYVADLWNHLIRKITPDGSVSTLAGSGETGYKDGVGKEAVFNSISDVAVDAAGNVYVADLNNHRIRKISPAGVVSTVAGSGERGFANGIGLDAKFNYPHSIALDAYGNLYITDQGNHRIRKVQLSPQIIIPAGQTTGTLVVQGIEDSIDEEDETIVLITASVANAILTGSEQVTLTLLDNSSPPAVNLSFSDTIVAENGGSVDLVVKLSSVSGKDVTLTFTTSGTADASDYTLSSTTLTITAGQESGKITITGKDDDLVEVLETLVLTVASVTNATVEQSSITCYIESEDKPTVSLAVSKISFAEVEQTVVTATISEPTAKDVVIGFSASGNAIINKDFEVDYVGIVSTFAGSGTQGSTDGTGTSASFRNPYGLTVDAAGNIYVADTGNQKIRKITPSGVVSTLAGSGTAGSTDGSGVNSTFYYPHGVAVDAAGNIYVADTGNQKIRKITPSGVVSTLAGSGIQSSEDGTGTSASFSGPYGLTVDAAGNVYVADTYNHKVRKITPSGVVSTLAGSGIQSSEDGTGTSASFNSPMGVAVDAAGNVYVAEADNHAVRKITPSGVVSTLAGSGTEGATDGIWIMASFRYPYGVAVDVVGNVYVADYGNHNIRKITPAGVVSTFAGSGIPGSTDDTGTLASFYEPYGVAVDAGGNVYVADTYNNKVRKVSTTPQIIIPAGLTKGTLTIKGLEDNLEEEDESIVLSAASVTNATLTGSNTLSLTLKDNRITLTKVVETPFPAVSSGAVAWGDFDQDGDQDVAIMGVSDLEGTITRIYKNNGGTFVNTNHNLERLRNGDIKWVDVNKDGYIDLAVSGINSIGVRKTNFYLNENGTVFAPVPGFNVAQVSSSKMAWGDLDNDGDIDLAIAGIDQSGTSIFYLYEKVDGQLTYQRIADFSGPGFTGGDLKIADVDLDGDNDILYKGGYINNSYVNTGSYDWSSSLDGLSYEVTKLDSASNTLSVLASGTDYNGTAQLQSNIGISAASGQLPRLKNGDVAAGDFNNDGRVDLVLTGEDDNGTSRTELFIQDGNRTFTKSSIALPGLRSSTATWVDYDVDGDLDLFMTGIEAGVQKTYLYKADVGIKVNRPPSAPSNLKFENLGNGFVRLSWDTPADDHSTYLGYNIRLGTTPGGSELSNTHSNLLTGARLITDVAPIHANSYLIQLSPGQYYWSVQAIDQGYQGGSFAQEATFALQYEWKTINQRGIVDRTILGKDKPIIALLDVDDDQDLGLVLASSTDRSLYLFNGKSFVLSSGAIGYGGVENVTVGDMNNDGKTDLVINTIDRQLQLYLGQGNSTMAHAWTGNGLVRSKLKITDFDNDGRSDLLIAGLTSLDDSGQPRFYRYEHEPSGGGIVWTDLSNQIVSFRNASYDFGDYDKDKDIDFIISGFDEDSGLGTVVYKNQTEPGGALSLARTTDNLVRVDNGTTDFVDYDGDGDLDVLFTGRSPNGNVFEVYENRLSGGVSTWVKVSTGLDPVRNAKIDLGDFNGDGYHDLLFTGLKEGVGKITRLTEFNPTTKKYLESTFDLGNVIDAEVEFGDIDGDGDMDLIIAGTDAANTNNRTFRAYLNVRNESARVTQQAIAQKGGEVMEKGNQEIIQAGEITAFKGNQPPAAPSIKSIRELTTAGKKQIEFNWNSSIDDNTPSAGLTYNLRIGITPTGNEVLTSNANANGTRKVVGKGNTEHNTSWILNSLPNGTYYWSVQAIDASYVGSAFSMSEKFEIKNGVLTTNQPPVVSELTIRKPAASSVGTVLGKVVVSDPENDVLSYSIVAGNPNDWFRINSQGEIIVNSIPTSYPEPMVLTVSVSDGTNAAQAAVTILICSQSSIYYTLKSGSWNDATIWSCGAVPTAINPARVELSHIISLPASYTATAQSIMMQGQIQYNLNSKIQIGQ